MQTWWQTGVFYALFPYSFQDSNGDGIGDIAGIRRRLNYLKWLGIDAVWVGPLYRSPMLDCGYDIADFCDIDPRFGSLADFDRLLAEIHDLDMRLVMDFVPNHTSDQHPWFIESRSSRTNPKRDWYIWRDPKPDGSPPNNWYDNVGDPAWTWDERTGQYYYRRFLAQQPDLNLRNPAVMAALKAVMRFWLDRGVDGFRLDAAVSLFEDELLRDEPDEPEEKQGAGPPGWIGHLFTSDRPETHRAISELRCVLEEYKDKVFIGEVQAPLVRFLEYYGRREPGFHLPFNSQLLKVAPWYARNVEAAIDQYMILLPDGAWPNWVLGSHDVKRLATRIGREQLRVAAMLLLTLPGTPFIYYGDEIGLENLELKPGEARDPYAKHGIGRDPERAPMPWSSEANAGFTEGKPWLPLPPDWQHCNIEALQGDERSLLNLYRALLALRRETPALQSATYQPLRGENDVLLYRRVDSDSRYLIALNFGPHPRPVPMDGKGRIVLSTELDRNDQSISELRLRPYEGVIVAQDLGSEHRADHQADPHAQGGRRSHGEEGEDQLPR